MPQTSTSFSSSTPLNIAPGQGAASSAVMPGGRPFAPYHDQDGRDPASASLSRLHEWVGTLDRYLRLPNSFQSFSIYLIGLTLVFVGATLHVWVAAQIMQAEYRLAALEQERIAIEQEMSELLFVYARDTNLNRMRSRAIAAGYVPITDREYVVLQDEPAQANIAVQATGQTPAAALSQADAPHADSQVGNQADSTDASPLRQWDQLLRGQVTWSQQPTQDLSKQPMVANRLFEADSFASGAGWQARWQQVLDQGKQLFTSIDLR